MRGCSRPVISRLVVSLELGWRRSDLSQIDQPEALVEKSFLQDNQSNPVVDKPKQKRNLMLHVDLARLHDYLNLKEFALILR
jgi:hypothetical protein